MIELLFYPTNYECKKFIELGKKYKQEILEILNEEKSNEKS